MLGLLRLRVKQVLHLNLRRVLRAHKDVVQECPSVLLKWPFPQGSQEKSHETEIREANYQLKNAEQIIGSAL